MIGILISRPLKGGGLSIPWGVEVQWSTFFRLWCSRVLAWPWEFKGLGFRVVELLFHVLGILPLNRSGFTKSPC